MADIEDLSGLDKVSILFKALGPSVAQPLFGNLSGAEVAKIQSHLNQMEEVTPEVIKAVLEEYYFSFISQNAIETEDLENPFAFLKKLTNQQLSQLIHNESPRIIALVLAQLPAERSAVVFTRLTNELQEEVIIQLGGLDDLSIDVIEEITGNLKERANTIPKFADVTSKATESLTGILSNLDTRTEKYLLDTLQNRAPSLSEAIKKIYFIFTDFLLLPDDIVREVLRGVEPQMIALALKGTSQELKEIFYRNLSERAALIVKDEYRVLGAVPRRKAQEMQRTLVNKVRELEKSGLFSMEDIIESEMVE